MARIESWIRRTQQWISQTHGEVRQLLDLPAGDPARSWASRFSNGAHFAQLAGFDVRGAPALPAADDDVKYAAINDRLSTLAGLLRNPIEISRDATPGGHMHFVAGPTLSLVVNATFLASGPDVRANMMLERLIDVVATTEISTTLRPAYVDLVRRVRNAESLAAGSDGVPAALAAVPVAVTGMCAAGDHLVISGARVRDGKPVMLELEASGKIIHELELPIAGTLHRAAQPVCTSAGVRVVWEERGPGNASILMWSELAAGVLGPAHSHAWPDRTVGFAAAADGARVLLLRDGGQPARSLLHRFAGSGPEETLALPAFGVANPVGAADGAAVLLVPTPQVLQLAMVGAGAVGSPLPVLHVQVPRTIDGGLLIAGERGAWTVAVASSGPDLASETANGEPMRRQDFALVACDASTAGPAQPIEPPLAGAWLDHRLVPWDRPRRRGGVDLAARAVTAPATRLGRCGGRDTPAR